MRKNGIKLVQKFKTREVSGTTDFIIDVDLFDDDDVNKLRGNPKEHSVLQNYFLNLPAVQF